MKISYNWLKDYITTDLPIEKVDEILTDTGLEVEGVTKVEAFPGGLKGLLVGQVMEVRKHPGADRLQCTKVDVGSGEWLDIVCGAPNVAKGQKVVVATVGSMLHPSEGEPFKIKKSKIRGEVSLGMLCAEDEIGLGASHEGIMVLDEEATIGTPVRELFEGEDDHVLEIGLTPNRTDAICHLGVARDLAAWLNKDDPTTITIPVVESHGSGTPSITIDVEDTGGCIRYCGIELENVTVAPSPDWLQGRLRAIGLSPINNVVDITNYVMHDRGQPLHAFDIDRIGGGKVVVRRAKAGEAFTTLEGTERKLDAADLLIADAQEGMCLAGVFGGIQSGVTETTTKVFLESACFDPVSVRKTAKRHQLSTDSSFRFERGVDPNQTADALWVAVKMLEKITGAKVTSEMQDIYPDPVTPFEFTVNIDRLNGLIGKELPEDTITSILHSLDIEVKEQKGTDWILAIPTYRIDVTREADVVEEILRIYGYNNVEIPTKMSMVVTHSDGPDEHAIRNTLAELLCGAGFTEMMNNSLTASSYADLLGGEEKERVSMLNPLSKELDTLRQTLLWNGLETIAYNRNRKRADLRLFEFGKVYSRAGEEFIEQEKMGIYITGSRRPENWDVKSEDSSFTDLLAVVEQLLQKCGVNAKQKDIASPLFAQALSYAKGERSVVETGIVAQDILKKFDIDSPVYFASIDVASIMKSIRRTKIAVRPIPKFPEVRRDFSLLIDKSVTFGAIEQAARKSGGKLLQEVGLFDVYEGKNLPEGKRSYAVSFILLDKEKTLTDKLVDKTMGKIQGVLEKELGAELRG